MINGGPYPNGRNQESSSEAIAAYEAVALYGDVLYTQWGASDSITEKFNDEASIAGSVRDMGRLLLATELRSADRYWHVRKDGPRIYPKEYQPLVVGMLWSLMAQFQTWFGSAPFLGYGIQLMPLTPIAEKRDEIKWANDVYPIMKESCDAAQDCQDQGWSILLRGLQATIGDKVNALAELIEIPKAAFLSAGGNGHSLTNTIWWIATRPDTQIMLSDDDDEDDKTDNNKEDKDDEEFRQRCRLCSPKECQSVLNRCPLPGAPFLCLEGNSVGGCSQLPWDVTEGSGSGCLECCEVEAGC